MGIGVFLRLLKVRGELGPGELAGCGVFLCGVAAGFGLYVTIHYLL